MFYFRSKDKVSVVLANGTICEFNKSSGNYDKVNKLIENNNWIEVENVYNAEKNLFSADEIAITNEGEIAYQKGEKEHKISSEDNLSKLCKTLKENGIVDSDLKKAMPFLKKVVTNNFINAAYELYTWCKNMDFGITEKGDILAYKVVQQDLTAKHDSKTTYKLNKPVEVSDFDTDRKSLCSSGLHFCARSYLETFAGKNDLVIILRIDPRDVVSIPEEGRYTKGRCRKCVNVKVLCTHSEFRRAPYADKSIEEHLAMESSDTVKRLMGKKTHSVTQEKNSKPTSDEVVPITTNRVQITLVKYLGYLNHGCDRKQALENTASAMGIAVSTVERNLRKAGHKEKK